MNDRREQLLAALERDIQQDCADYLELNERMQALYECLMVRDCPRIESLNAQIESLVEGVRLRAERRSRALRALRLEPDGGGVRALLDSYPPARRASLQQSWQQLGQLAQQCHRLNERNGQLLAMHHEILTHLFAVPGSGGLYAQPY